MSSANKTARPASRFFGAVTAAVMVMLLGLGLFLNLGSVAAQTDTPTAGATTAAGTTTAAGATTAAATTAAGSTTAAGTTAAGGSQLSGNTINVFCLDFGKDFPTGQTIKAQGLANDKVRGGLAYALSKGYITSNPYQVQLALWNLSDGQPFHDTLGQGTTVAQEIVNNASGSAPAAGDTSAVSNLTLINFQEASPKAAYGTATVQGSASTSGLPVGFLLPASAPNFQNLVAVVATGNTAAPATTAASTTSAATTAAATTASTTVSSTTSAATTAATTTVAATTAPATTVAATTVATTVATTTVATTAATTTASVTTAVAGAQASPTVGGQGGAPAAPATGFGGGQDSSSYIGLVLMLVGLLIVAGAATISLRVASRKQK